MRKWRDLAKPDDQGAWNDVGGMWPTRRGTYETADISTTSVTKSPLTNKVLYAFAFGKDPSTGTIQEYVSLVIAGTGSIHSWDGTNLTSRFGSASLGTRGSIAMARYGGITLAALALGAGTRLQAATSFGGSFADVAGSPTDKNIIAIQSSAVLLFSSSFNTWAASDVGDYTNWSTGESASGTIFSQPGNISAAISYGNDVFAFKPGSIHRMTYVGGAIKWQVQTAWVGLGVPDRASLSTTDQSTQDWAIATQHGIVFYGGNGNIYLFDGVSEPKCLNPETTIPVETIRGVFTYDPIEDRLCIAPGNGSSATGTALTEGSSATFTSLYYYYSFPFDAWGAGVGSNAELQQSGNGAVSSGVVRGNYYNRNEVSSKPAFWATQASGIGGDVKRCSPTSPASGSSGYLQTKKVGRPDRKTTFTRLIPLLRHRTDLGTDSAALSFELFRELEDTSAQNTNSVVESTTRKRFDLLGAANTDNFGRFKVTWTDLDVEVDDFLVVSEDAGVD